MALPRAQAEGISIEHDKEVYSFTSSDIDEIVEARLEELFESVQAHLKKSGQAGQLPSGVVLTGGTSKLAGIVELAKRELGVAARVGKPTGFAGMAEQVDEPQYATAVGLMLLDTAVEPKRSKRGGKKSAKMSSTSAKGMLSSFLGRFKA